MKKINYFKLSSLIQIIVSFLMVIFSNQTLKQIIKAYQKLYDETGDKSFLESISTYENNGKIILIILAIITVILNIIVLYNIFNKKENYNQKLILITSLICFFITESNVISWLSIINFVLCLSKKNPEAEKTVKKEKITVEPLNQEEYSKGEIILAIASLFIYYYLPDLVSLLPFSYISLSIILDILLIIICFLIFKKEIIKGFKALKDNVKKYFKYIINKQLYMLLIYYVVCIIVTMLTSGDGVSLNQKMAESLPMLYIIPSSVLYAPFVEELIFRGSLRRFIKNDKAYIIISGLSFGLIHTMYEKTIFDMIVLSLPYATLGCYFAYIYVKTNNITSSMIGHFLHNSFACLLLLIT